MSTECKKNEDRNLYDLICKLIETGYYIETLSLYDGADDLFFLAKDYVKATDIKFTVKNSSELETVTMKDKQVLVNLKG